MMTSILIFLNKIKRFEICMYDAVCISYVLYSSLQNPERSFLRKISTWNLRPREFSGGGGK